VANGISEDRTKLVTPNAGLILTPYAEPMNRSQPSKLGANSATDLPDLELIPPSWG
jgi:hypothetical protein